MLHALTSGTPDPLAALTAKLRRIVGNILGSRRRDARVVGLVGICLIALIGMSSWYLRAQTREVAQVAAEKHVEQLAKTASYQLAAKLTMIDHAMRYAEGNIRETGGPERLAELGAAGHLSIPSVDHFSFSRRDGEMVFDSVNPTTAGKTLNASKREFFRIHLDRPGVTTYVVRPIESRLTGEMLLPISRAVRGADGGFIGVVSAMIDVPSLGSMWNDVGLGPADRIDLIGDDSKIWLSWPRSSSNPVLDKDMATVSIYRIAAIHPLADWPLKIAAGIDQQAVDREIGPTQKGIVISTIVASLLIAWFCLMLSRRTQQAADERDTANAMRTHMLAAIDAVPVEFIEYDRDRRLVLANQASRNASPWRAPGAASGRTIDEVMATYTEHFATAETAGAWNTWVRQTIANFDSCGVADTHRPDGQWRRSYVSDMPTGGRMVVRVDITETKLREEQLAAEMERLNSVFQSTGAAILLLDRAGFVVLANQSSVDMHGMKDAKIVGLPYSELNFAGLDPAILTHWQAKPLTERLKPTEFECSLPGTDGERRILRFTANPIQDDGGQLSYIVLIGVDDTQRRKAEVRLFDSSRLANLGEMATGIAHEINQPLAVIRLAAESLREELDSPEAKAVPPDLADFIISKLERITGQTERASAIIRDLRTVARKPVGNLQPFDLADAVRVSSELLREQLRLVRVDFKVDVPTPGPMVLGEASRIQQVLINLVMNARDALCDRGGPEPVGLVGSIVVRVAADPAGCSAVLTIEDDGPGIPAKVLPRLFEPFFTTKPVGKGTGLGLSISSEIVRRMNGEISAENRDSGGARFRIVLPLLPSAAATVQQSSGSMNIN